MANKRPVNRVSPQRRPAAQRSTGTRTTAESVRESASTDKGTASTGNRTARKAAARPSAAGRGPNLTKTPVVEPERTQRVPGEFFKTWRTALLCGGLAVLLAVVAIVGALRPGVDDANKAYIDNSATDEVKAAATHALTVLYAFKASDINKDKWKAAVGSVVTEQMARDFDKYIDTTVDSIKQAQADTQVTTDPIGVTVLTEDRAELLVNLNVVTVKDGQPAPFASGPVLLRMQKIDGDWRASEITNN